MWLCASCASPLDLLEHDPEQPCPRCHGPVLLDARYRLERRLGAHGAGITYQGRRLSDDQLVAIKELSFKRLDSLKTQVNFEREARTLRQLHHEGIPAYLDDFVWGVGKHQAHYLIEEYIQGQTLDSELQNKRYDEAEALRTVEAICRVLTYLHELSPPVIHRDLKPENIMRRPDGRVVLLDFGATLEASLVDAGALSVAGTFGYMAPEQFMGQASPRSDLFAVGVIAVVLLSRAQPLTLLNEEHTLAWEPHLAHLSGPTKALLSRALARDPKARFESATELRRAARAARRALKHKDEHALALTSHANQLAPIKPREESLFGVLCLALGATTLSLPCLVLALGLGNTIIALCLVMFASILSIPFLPDRSAMAPEDELDRS